MESVCSWKKLVVRREWMKSTTLTLILILIFASGSGTEDHKIKNVYVDSKSRNIASKLPHFFTQQQQAAISLESCGIVSLI